MRRRIKRAHRRLTARFRTRYVALRQRARRHREALIVTTLFVGGLASIAFGFGLMYLPLGFVVGGSLSSFFAALWATRSATRKQEAG